jgi:hypothetical protein
LPPEPVAPDVRRLVLPAPYPVGPVNAYLVLGSEPALIDAGPASPEGVEALVAGLAAAGVEPGDVRRVVVIPYPRGAGL